MSTAAYLWAHLQTALLALLPLALVPSVVRRPWSALTLAAGLAWLPLGALDLSSRLLSYSGLLSLTSLLLLTDQAARRLADRRLLAPLEQRLLLLGAGLLGLVLYPPALGLGRFDPYGLGLAGITLPLALGATAALAWWHARRGPAWLLLGALWAWLLGIGESQDLWDYLIDPWVVLYAFLRGILTPFARRSGAPRNRPVTRP
jgi:hypothetical protein